MLLKRTYSKWNDEHAPGLGAALSYYTDFSLAPLLMIVIAIAGLVFGHEAAQGQIMGRIQGLVGEENAKAIQTMIEEARKPASTSGIIEYHLEGRGKVGREHAENAQRSFDFPHGGARDRIPAVDLLGDQRGTLGGWRDVGTCSSRTRISSYHLLSSRSSLR